MTMDNIPLTGAEEASTIASLHSLTLEPGQIWSLIDLKWLEQWSNYTGYNLTTGKQETPKSSNRPGPIDNSRLIDSSVTCVQTLLRPIAEHVDYGLVNESVADKLYLWYNQSVQDKHRIDRKVVSVGLYKTCQLQLYPTPLRLVNIDETSGEPVSLDQSEIRVFDSKGNFNDVRKQLLAEMKIDESDEKEPQMRFWLENPEAQVKAAEATSPEPDFVMVGPVTENGNADAVSTSTESPSNNTASDPALSDTASEVASPKPPKIEPYVQLTEDQYKQPLETFEFTPGTLLLVEKRKADGSWPRVVVEKDWRQFEIGDVIDCRDTVQKYYESTIMDIKGDKLFVHFNGWATTWDEWIPKDSDRLAKRGTYSKGPRQTASNTTSTSTGMSSWSSGWGWGGYGNSREGRPEPEGAVGLQNLGNTCFMNSVLQSMMHCPLLTDYFLTDQYIAHINRDNPLGWKGKIAEEYAKLVKDYWSSKYTVIAPRSFKQALGEFAPRFSGYQQQDSSELLSFLLDGLHEDLNLVKKKPPTNAVESNNRPDEVVAKESWDVYQMRNQSVVVDKLQGQLKSKLVCPDEACGKISITFDPFMFLSAPLPVMENCVQIIHFVYADPSKPITVFSPVVSKVARIVDLCEAVSKLNGVPAKSMVVADMWNHKFYRILDEDGSVSEIRRNDVIYVYEVSETENYKSTSEFIPVQVVHQTMTKNEHYNPNYMMSKAMIAECFGLPRVIALPKKRDVTVAEIKQHVHAIVQQVAKPGAVVDYAIHTLDGDGRNCYKCGMMSSCSGCLLEETDQPFDLKIDRADNSAGVSFAIMWKSPPGTNLPPQSAYNDVFDKQFARDASVENVNNPNLLNKRHEGVELTDCLKAFTKAEKLGEGDEWYCNKCKDFKQATKQMSIYSLPQILIIHLKRFSYTKTSRDKINTLVNFPLEGLDLSSFVVSEECKKDAVYDCFAVSNHMGGLGGGHYTAYCKNLVTQQWFLHDDSSVSPVGKEDNIVSSAAYVLFYKLRSLPSPPSRTNVGKAAQPDVAMNGSTPNGLHDHDMDSPNVNSPLNGDGVI